MTVDEKRERGRLRYAENRAHIAARVKRNPNTRVSQRRYEQKRLRTDPLFRLAKNLRQRLRNALKGRNKSAATMLLLGCTVEELHRHLEAQFQPGMTWGNYGAWHIDHIKPCVSFDLADPVQQRACFHWTNLQPLWALDNIKKYDKVS